MTSSFQPGCGWLATCLRAEGLGQEVDWGSQQAVLGLVTGDMVVEETLCAACEALVEMA